MPTRIRVLRATAFIAYIKEEHGDFDHPDAGTLYARSRLARSHCASFAPASYAL
jgi:hypothetical protein